MNKLSIYQRMLLVLSSVAMLLIVMFILIFVIKNRQKELLIDNMKNQLESEVNALMKLKGQTLDQIAFDYTYWDEFYQMIDKGNRAWFNENISTIVQAYHVDNVTVIDTFYRVVHKASADSFSEKNIISHDAIKEIFKHRILRYYLMYEGVLYEISAATVHSTDDPTHMVTKPHGALFVVKKWDSNYIKELSDITGNEVKIGKAANLINDDDAVLYRLPLKDYNHIEIASVTFIKRSSFMGLYNNLSIYILVILISSFVLSFLLFSYSMRKWIYDPLKLISTILYEEDSQKIEELKRAPGEFSKIGNLFQTYSQHKQELNRAKTRAEQSDKLKTSFLLNLSHEIRTPMNAIMGFTELLKSDSTTEEEKMAYLKMLKDSSSRLFNTINDIVDMSKIETGNIEVFKSSFKIGEIVNDIYIKYKEESVSKKIKLLSETSDQDSVRYIHSDKEKIVTVLSHLVRNSIKYTDQGFIRISAILEGDDVVFIVEDTGIGIPKSRQETIFESFWRGELTVSDKYEGSGLGLTISKAYSDILGGKLWFESEFGKGTKFYFSVPRQLITK